MNKATTLMLVAASLSTMPLIATEPSVAAQSFTAMSLPTVSASTPKQLAEQVAPAAILPADVDLAVVLPHLGGNLRNLVSDDEFPFDSVVLGCAKGSAGTYAALRQCQIRLGLPTLLKEGAQSWKSVALDSLGDLILKAADEAGQDSDSKIAGDMQKAVIHPIYLIASPKPGAEETVQQAVMAYSAMAIMSAQGQEGVEAVNIQGLNGVKVSGAVLADAYINLGSAPPDWMKTLKEELSKRTFYLLAGMKGDNAVVVLCENPEEIHWAPTPEQSILTAEPWKSTNLGKDAKPWAFLTLSPEMQNASNGLSILTDLAKHAGSLFQSMGAVVKDKAAVFQAAAGSFGTVAETLTAMTPTSTKTSSLAVWETPGHFHVTIQGDAQGGSYKLGKLRLAAMADSPKNLIYVEGTDFESGIKVDPDKLITAGDDILKGVTASLNPDSQVTCDKCTQQVADVMPELKNAWQSLCTISEGLTNTGAYVVSAPDVAKGVPAPAVSLYAGVGDRAKLAAGWGGLRSAVCNIAKKAGCNDCEMKFDNSILIDIRSGATAYVFTNQELPAEIQPNVLINDSHVALGTSVAFNEEVVNSATGSTDFEGCVFSINVAGIAKMLEDEMPGPAVHVAPAVCNCADAEDSDEDDGCGCGDDEDGDCCCCCAKDSDEDCSSGESVICEFLERAAKVIDNVKGTSTIKDGVHTLRLDIKLR